MVWVCCCRLVDTRAYRAMRIGFLLSDSWRWGGCGIGRPAQQELIGTIPAPLSIRMGNSLTADLPGSVHSTLLHTNNMQEDREKTYYPKVAGGGPRRQVRSSVCIRVIQNLSLATIPLRRCSATGRAAAFTS